MVMEKGDAVGRRKIKEGEDDEGGRRRRRLRASRGFISSRLRECPASVFILSLL